MDSVHMTETVGAATTSPPARSTYRHGDLRRALLDAGIALATAMESELAGLRRRRDPAAFARARLRAIGSSYLRFAQAEPGLFRTAFSAPEELPDTAGPGKAGPSGLDPFEHLGAALDSMVETGALPRARRPGAEYLAWSTVHGLAMLVIDGPLRRLAPAQVREI